MDRGRPLSMDLFCCYSPAALPQQDPGLLQPLLSLPLVLQQEPPCSSPLAGFPTALGIKGAEMSFWMLPWPQAGHRGSCLALPGNSNI